MWRQRRRYLLRKLHIFLFFFIDSREWISQNFIAVFLFGIIKYYLDIRQWKHAVAIAALPKVPVIVDFLAQQYDVSLLEVEVPVWWKNENFKLIRKNY